MPELPEVETMAAGLRGELLGKGLLRVRVLEGSVLRKTSAEAVGALGGARLVGLSRKGKFLLFHLSNGSVLLFHLKMTGRFLVVARDDPPGRWERLHLEFEGWERKLAFVDPRKFGYLALIHEEEEPPVPLLYELGPDALQLSSGEFREILGQSRRPVKALLLDQRRIAGLGNIYVDESLHQSGIHPRTPAAAIDAAGAARLHRAVQEILRKAIECGGSSVRTFRDSLGARGTYQDHHRVYGRRGEPCRSCGAAISYTRVASRGTHLCPACQKPVTLRRKRRRGKG